MTVTIKPSTAAAIRDALAMLSPGPYQWGLIEDGPKQAENVLRHISFGSGEIHGVYLPTHEKSVVGADPMAPEHLVSLCWTGNGPKSKDNARALVLLLTALSEEPALRPSAGREVQQTGGQGC